MPAKTLSVLTFHADLSWALARAPGLHGQGRGTFDQALIGYSWLLQDFTRLLDLLPWQEKTRITYDLARRLTDHNYEERVLRDVLNASGVSPQDLEAYRLNDRSPSTSLAAQAKRL